MDTVFKVWSGSTETNYIWKSRSIDIYILRLQNDMTTRAPQESLSLSLSRNLFSAILEVWISKYNYYFQTLHMTTQTGSSVENSQKCWIRVHFLCSDIEKTLIWLSILFGSLSPLKTKPHWDCHYLMQCTGDCSCSLISWLKSVKGEVCCVSGWCHSFVDAFWPWESIWQCFIATQSSDPFPVSWHDHWVNSHTPKSTFRHRLHKVLISD